MHTLRTSSRTVGWTTSQRKLSWTGGDAACSSRPGQRRRPERSGRAHVRAERGIVHGEDEPQMFPELFQGASTDRAGFIRNHQGPVSWRSFGQALRVDCACRPGIGEVSAPWSHRTPW
mmetsp:Transcript_78845/g.219207  ORF Transcript_78845/g.219207 Transcript_78845/m.219207 type:complete len:118 (-) Transcript_78845:65-418(-)